MTLKRKREPSPADPDEIVQIKKKRKISQIREKYKHKLIFTESLPSDLNDLILQYLTIIIPDVCVPMVTIWKIHKFNYYQCVLYYAKKIIVSIEKLIISVRDQRPYCETKHDVFHCLGGDTVKSMPNNYFDDSNYDTDTESYNISNIGCKKRDLNMIHKRYHKWCRRIKTFKSRDINDTFHYNLMNKILLTRGRIKKVCFTKEERRIMNFKLKSDDEESDFLNMEERFNRKYLGRATMKITFN